MAKRKRFQDFPYSETFDRLMEEQFGEKFETSYNILSMRFITRRASGKKLTRQQMLFGRGLSSGMSAALEWALDG
jgi:hypothetical protein